jgi:hypothetical protein
MKILILFFLMSVSSLVRADVIFACYDFRVEYQKKDSIFVISRLVYGGDTEYVLRTRYFVFNQQPRSATLTFIDLGVTLIETHNGQAILRTKEKDIDCGDDTKLMSTDFIKEMENL